MKIKTIIVFLLLMPFVGNSQNDTINQLDENDLKQGYWIYYGKDRPESDYPDDGIIEEGSYLDDRKTGRWIKYYSNGAVKATGEYTNNRPSCTWIKYYPDGSVRDTIIDITEAFRRNELSRGGHRGNTDYQIELVNSESSVRIIDSANVENQYSDSQLCEEGNEGFTKTFNSDGEVIYEGTCRDNKVSDGKMYFYDSDGILLRIEIWKDGKYHSLGQI
ncbi:MAG: hypothetical protein QNK23_08585 [Crocinitomicaceae bacterium]|nr:hypothetical protein [Crocinitomicaceae bacterium]